MKLIIGVGVFPQGERRGAKEGWSVGPSMALDKLRRRLGIFGPPWTPVILGFRPEATILRPRRLGGSLGLIEFQGQLEIAAFRS